MEQSLQHFAKVCPHNKHPRCRPGTASEVALPVCPLLAFSLLYSPFPITNATHPFLQDVAIALRESRRLGLLWLGFCLLIRCQPIPQAAPSAPSAPRLPCVQASRCHLLQRRSTLPPWQSRRATGSTAYRRSIWRCSSSAQTPWPLRRQPDPRPEVAQVGGGQQAQPGRVTAAYPHRPLGSLKENRNRAVWRSPR